MAMLICISKVSDLILGPEANSLIFITVSKCPPCKFSDSTLQQAVNGFLKYHSENFFPFVAV
jgi:hypothetical protein